MKKLLKGKSLLTLMDYTPEEIRCILDTAHAVKKKSGGLFKKQKLKGKTCALLFEKTSTRTRCATETAIAEEGGHSVFLSLSDMQLGAKETLEDTARVLGRMFDSILFRGFSQTTCAILSKYSGVPVYNGLTDDFHPTQALADLMTIEEQFGTIKGKNICYIGDGRNNVANSLMIASCRMGANCTICAPESLWPQEAYIHTARTDTRKYGTKLNITSHIDEGTAGADVIYTDVWVSMGEEDKSAERLATLKDYQVNNAMMKRSGRPSTIFLHCLPAVRGNEVTADIIDGPASYVWDQAENRKHTIKAIMLATIT